MSDLVTIDDLNEYSPGLNAYHLFQRYHPMKNWYSFRLLMSGPTIMGYPTMTDITTVTHIPAEDIPTEIDELVELITRRVEAELDARGYSKLGE